MAEREARLDLLGFVPSAVQQSYIKRKPPAHIIRLPVSNKQLFVVLGLWWMANAWVFLCRKANCAHDTNPKLQ
jgi:hypothetical protein